ncbi:hypothetical protein CgunFtcFv8_022223 [Champsocephalus gunnari]|uniref:Uncharacterized protein n=1 Tax=Champsocephalus gunnari TaxID=52237 RepID=A0AAN8DQH4_CHAGU|nr:hypothetical protein CgunFtcFv8_022223 [Champsocephalus gunnari]
MHSVSMTTRCHKDVTLTRHLRSGTRKCLAPPTPKSAITPDRRRLDSEQVSGKSLTDGTEEESKRKGR